MGRYLFFCAGFFTGKLVEHNMGWKSFYNFQHRIGNYEAELSLGIPWGLCERE
uniref:Uncharacterized protein n=1 Tax=viral metagenome TaxID=1070528 RepID=A0A6C0BLW6_9ZZZZ